MLQGTSQAWLTQWRSTPGSLTLLSIALWLIPALASAESLPAGIRACAAETDSLRRLVCYDREVARFNEAKPAETKPTTKQAPPSPPASSAAGTNSPTPPPAGAPLAATPPAPSPAANPPSAEHNSAAKDAAHFSARVVSIDHVPIEMVLHLDNGEVWQQVQSVTGDLSLQVGDTVKIDKRLGSYWLSGPHVSGMKVARQKG